MITPKRLVRGAFESADLPRLPFIPWIFTHAAKLEQIPVRRIFADPTQYTKCLHNAQKLYGYDAVISSFDASLEMEICGCALNWRGDYEAPVARPNPEFDLDRITDINIENASKSGRFATVIECLRRINSVAGQNLAMVGVIHGPLTLIAGLTGRDPLKDLSERPEETSRALEAAAGLLLKIIQIYCQQELDAIAVVERPIVFCPPDQLPGLQSIYSPIINTVRFYNAYSVLLPGESAPNNITRLLDFGFDGIIIPGIDVKAWHEIKGGRSCVLGKAIPVHLLNSGSREIQTYLEAHLPEKAEPGFFLTTDGELPPETLPDNIHLLMKMISQH